ncbi:PEP-CTERM sorting domain-containing protein [Sphaerotilaceae bacterium SBD11-9]
MKKKLLTSLAVAALSMGAAGAHATSLSCNDPLTSAIGQRFCVEKFDSLAPGQYNVSFEYQAEKLAGTSIDKVLSFGFLFGSDSHDITRGLLSDSTGTTGWNTYSFLTQATDDAALIFALRGVPGPRFGLALQNIQITAVPEPATLAMLLAGLGAIVFVGRRRRI